MEAPRTQYAKTEDGTNIAYQVLGDGPFDLVFVPGFVSHVEQNFQVPVVRSALERLASFSRLILFDKRGTGMSDPAPGAPSLDTRMDDLRAVMDAAGSAEAALLGISEGGPMSVSFAATYPERTRALVLYGSLARLLCDPPDYPWGPTADDHEQFIEAAKETWGTPSMMYVAGPSITEDDALMEASARYMRLGASPGAVGDLMRWWAEIDIRSVLPAIHVPTLVLHRRGDQLVPVEAGRYLAEHVPGARYVELDGVDHLPWFGDTDALLGEIEEFLTGERREIAPDRVLATVVFTDIVGSTERAAADGDAAWRALLDRHDETASELIATQRGSLIKSTGDGLLATFDGPARGVQAAQALVRAMPGIGLEIRAGVHTGEIELRGDDVGGIGVHIGARVAALADAGEVLVSRTVKDLVAGSRLLFEDRGVHELKGVPDEWHLYAAVST